jgi:hypothetical protein
MNDWGNLIRVMTRTYDMPSPSPALRATCRCKDQKSTNHHSTITFKHRSQNRATKIHSPPITSSATHQRHACHRYRYEGLSTTMRISLRRMDYRCVHQERYSLCCCSPFDSQLNPRQRAYLGCFVPVVYLGMNTSCPFALVIQSCLPRGGSEPKHADYPFVSDVADSGTSY